MAKYPQYSALKEAIQNGNTTHEAVVNHYLSNIEAQKNLNCFLDVYADEAIEQAKALDAGAFPEGKVRGMVIGLKDNIAYKNHPLSASSKMLENFESLISADVTEKLVAEGAIIIGRLNCDEFAMGSSNENSAFGSVKNPLNEECVPGGSSGGSAAAVAADLCMAALGTDTGGSIRQPASFCGVVGLKPTYGRISRYGLVAYGSSWDQAGPITHSVADAALLMEIMAGKDHRDTTSSSRAVEAYSQKISTAEPKPKRFAFLKDCITSEGLDSEIRTYFENFQETLKSQGHEVELVDFPYQDYLIPIYQILSNAEASSNLSRYAGQIYGYRSKAAQNTEDTFVKSRSEGFGKEVKRRILLGSFVLSEGYYDAYYLKAQKARKLIRDYCKDLFQKYDFVVNPTTPHTAFKIGENKAPIKMYLEDIYTLTASITGMPAISLPFGQHSNGMPFGVQLMANDFEESELLQISHFLSNK